MRTADGAGRRRPAVPNALGRGRGAPLTPDRHRLCCGRGVDRPERATSAPLERGTPVRVVGQEGLSLS